MLLTFITTRVRQLTKSLTATPLTSEERHFVDGLLNSVPAQLFFALAIYEQRHALRVCQTLCAGGFGTDKELLQAALLHDLGKYDPQTGRTVPLWGKVANVIFSTMGAKPLMKRLASPDPKRWGYVFWLQLEHEKRGARMAFKAGSSKRVIALIGGCKTLEKRGDLSALALKWADDLN